MVISSLHLTFEAKRSCGEVGVGGGWPQLHLNCQIRMFKSDSAVLFCSSPPQDSAMFSLDLSPARPMKLILTSAETSYAIFTLNKDVNLYVSLALFHPFVFRASSGGLL